MELDDFKKILKWVLYLLFFSLSQMNSIPGIININSVYLLAMVVPEKQHSSNDI